MKTLYFDCSSGASGDMLLGALLDLLLSLSGFEEDAECEQALQPWISQIQGLLQCEQGGRYSIKRVQRGAVSAQKVEFFVGQVSADIYHNKHRGLQEIESLLEKQHGASGLSTRALEFSKKTFQILAQAEAVAHNTTAEKVHFHEVGAFDSIMDIAGFAAALSLLEAEHICASPVTLGSGTVKTAHGILPVPPPAVAEIISAFNIPPSETILPGECLTPTGAALLAASVERWLAVPQFKNIAGQGVAAGTREIKDKPNVLRVIYGEML